MISLKNLISRSPVGLGSLNFTDAPKIILKNQDGLEVQSYEELKGFTISADEEIYRKEKWDKVLEKHPTFYDGDVTAILDIVYDERDNELSFIMSKMKYSLSAAINDVEYPNQERRKDFISFGIGMMADMEINSDSLNSDLLMVRRSTKVLNEQNAISVPGGSLEYKAGKKDDVKKGMHQAVLSEVQEEVFPTADPARFKVSLMSVGWEKGGLNAYFNVVSQDKISQIDLERGMKSAKDKYEHTGAFFVDTAGNNFDVSSKEVLKGDRFTVGQIINSGKLEASGIHSLSAKVFQDAVSFNNKGIGFASMPHPQALAEKFLCEKFPDFTFLDVGMFKSKAPREICWKPELVHLKKNDKEENRSK